MPDDVKPILARPVDLSPENLPVEAVLALPPPAQPGTDSLAAGAAADAAPNAQTNSDVDRKALREALQNTTASLNKLMAYTPRNLAKSTVSHGIDSALTAGGLQPIGDPLEPQ
jgi:hypothetical protein